MYVLGIWRRNGTFEFYGPFQTIDSAEVHLELLKTQVSRLSTSAILRRVIQPIIPPESVHGGSH